MTSVELVPTRVTSSSEAPGQVGQGAAARPRLVSPVSAALAAATPAVTLPMLALARYWSGQGALHSVGDLVPLALGGAVSLVGAQVADDPVLTGTCLAVAGTCVAVGAMAYPAGMGEPLIVTVLATVLGWALSWRAARGRGAVAGEYVQRQADRDLSRDLAVIAAQTSLGVATIAGQASVQAAQVSAAATVAAAEHAAAASVAGRGFADAQLEAAWAHRRALDSAAAAPKVLTGAAAAPPVDDLYGLAESLGLGERR